MRFVGRRIVPKRARRDLKMYQAVKSARILASGTRTIAWGVVADVATNHRLKPSVLAAELRKNNFEIATLGAK